LTGRRTCGAGSRGLQNFGSAGPPEQIARLEISCVIKATEAGAAQAPIAAATCTRIAGC
jgi:hypothetical protein